MTEPGFIPGGYRKFLKTVEEMAIDFRSPLNQELAVLKGDAGGNWESGIWDNLSQ
jgi:hypothetical protein